MADAMWGEGPKRFRSEAYALGGWNSGAARRSGVKPAVASDSAVPVGRDAGTTGASAPTEAPTLHPCEKSPANGHAGPSWARPSAWNSSQAAAGGDACSPEPLADPIAPIVAIGIEPGAHVPATNPWATMSDRAVSSGRADRRRWRSMPGIVEWNRLRVKVGRNRGGSGTKKGRSDRGRHPPRARRLVPYTAQQLSLATSFPKVSAASLMPSERVR